MSGKTMRRGLWWVVVVLLIACWSSFPAQADGPTCWVCGGSPQGAACQVNNIPGFSKATCESRCFTFLGFLHCFCVTGGTFCAITPPPLTGKGLPSSDYSQGGLNDEVVAALSAEAPPLVDALIQRFGIDLGMLFRRPVTAANQGPVDGLISRVDPTDPSTAQYFAFEGRAEISGEMVTHDYVLIDHPEMARVSAQIWNHGKEGLVVVEYHDGRRITETLSVD